MGFSKNLDTYPAHCLKVVQYDDKVDCHKLEEPYVYCRKYLYATDDFIEPFLVGL